MYSTRRSSAMMCASSVQSCDCSASSFSMSVCFAFFIGVFLSLGDSVKVFYLAGIPGLLVSDFVRCFAEYEFGFPRFGR